VIFYSYVKLPEGRLYRSVHGGMAIEVPQ
jgi:hypothetical protein